MATRVLFPETTVTGSGASTPVSGFDQSTILRIQLDVTAAVPFSGGATLQDTLDGINFHDIRQIGNFYTEGITMTNIVMLADVSQCFGDTLRVRWNLAPTVSVTFSVIVNDKLISSPLTTIREK